MMRTDIWKIEFSDKESGQLLTVSVSGIGIRDALQTLSLALGYEPLIRKSSLVAPSAIIRQENLRNE